MFTPCPDGAGLAGAAGEDGTAAGADVAAWAVGPDAARLAVGDGRGHSRKAPRAARASTMRMKAILRCADVISMAGSYFRRRIGRSQNGPAGPLSPGCSGGAARRGAAGHDPPLAGLSLAGARSPPDPAPRPAPCPGERVKSPPLPRADGAEPVLAAGLGGA